MALAQAARNRDVHENVLRKRMGELVTNPQQVFLCNSMEKPETAAIEWLENEEARLREERDILKRLRPA